MPEFHKVLADAQRNLVARKVVRHLALSRKRFPELFQAAPTILFGVWLLAEKSLLVFELGTHADFAFLPAAINGLVRTLKERLKVVTAADYPRRRDHCILHALCVGLALAGHLPVPLACKAVLIFVMEKTAGRLLTLVLAELLGLWLQSSALEYRSIIAVPNLVLVF